MLTRSTNASPSIHGFHYATARSPRHSPSRISAIAAGVRRPSSSSPVLSDGATAPAAALPSPPPPPPPPPPPMSSTPARLLSDTGSPHPPAASSPRHYVAVDAATQYSPMEPFDYAAHPHRYPPKPATPLEPPPIPGPIPMEPGIEQGIEQGTGQADGPGDPQKLAPPPGTVLATTITPGGAPGGVPATAAAAATTTTTATATEPATATAATRTPTAKTLTAATTSRSSQHTLSPNKRRNSQDQTFDAGMAHDNVGEGPASPSTLVHSPQTGSKRIKAEAVPPKLLPERYELCAVEDMVVLIANMLSELIETNDALALKAGHLTRFHSRTAPGISVLDYLNRLAKHATLTPPLLLSMVYYIDRLCAMYPDFTINTLTVHRFLITAATVAAKGLSDSFWNNSTYARVGGVRVAELKMLELEFLYRLEWKIVPNPEVLAAYYRPLVERCPGYVLPVGSHDEAENKGVSGKLGNGHSLGNGSVVPARHAKHGGAGD